MYKISYIPTGHVFELPDEAAKELKEKFPEDYKILEKNGKKFCDGIIKHLTNTVMSENIRWEKLL